MKNKYVHLGIIGIFCSLYFLVATISMINSVEFFDLAHTGLMNWALAIGFELGAAASLAAIIILDKTNKAMVWGLFLLLTGFQMMANSYHAFVNLEDFQGWIELFGLQDEELIFQKRILSIVSGAVLPVVALGFIKSLTDYLKPEKETTKPSNEPTVEDLFNERNKVLTKKTIENDPQIKKVKKDQIERIVEQQKPFGEKLNKLRKDQKERIKEKTPLPVEPENLPLDKPIVDKTKEKDTDVITSPNGDVEVKVDGNVTYVTTKSKGSTGTSNNPKVAQ